MVNQYPHTLKYTTVTGNSLDGSGNWSAGSSSTVEKACRYEPESGSVFVTAENGEQIKVTGIVYMPLPAVTIQPGTQVEILEGVTSLLKNTVKRHNAGQLNQRVWL